MPDVDLNYWAILVAALASYALGALWYSPLFFGKLWVKLMEWSHETMEHHKKDAPRRYLGLMGVILAAWVWE